MILEIDETTNIGDMQSLFSASFPFLKLAVLKEKHPLNENKIHSEITDSNTLIQSIRKNKKVVFLEVHYWQKTKTVEKLFHDKAKVAVKIMRKQGEHWIETTGTEDLTLEEQNDIGRKATQELLHGINRPLEYEKPV